MIFSAGRSKATIGSKPPGPLAEGVVRLVHGQTSPHLAEMLEDCWPLHPVTACLLGPLSRRRFGQNQRSIFGFLNSAEPQGIPGLPAQRKRRRPVRSRSVVGLPADSTWSLPSWPPPTVIAGRWLRMRWAGARPWGAGTCICECSRLIAIVDWLKDRSGLAASLDLLKCALPGYGKKKLATALADLQGWSLIVFRKFAQAYAIFEGSDFDIEQAVEQASAGLGAMDLASLGAIGGPSTHCGKAPLSRDGSVALVRCQYGPLVDVEEAASGYVPRHGAIGSILSRDPDARRVGRGGEEDLPESRSVCLGNGISSSVYHRAPGTFLHWWRSCRHWSASRDETPELQGDRVARTEVLARITALQGQLESELGRAFDSAAWCRKHVKAKPLSHAELNGLASQLADARLSRVLRGSTMSFWAA